jgi:hypothetical protein
VHVDRDDLSAKFWLGPVALARNLGFDAAELRKVERLVSEQEVELQEAWMASSVPNPGEQVTGVRFTKDLLVVDLRDGRTISVPLAWYPRLLHATQRQRANWKPAGGGFGIH